MSNIQHSIFDIRTLSSFGLKEIPKQGATFFLHHPTNHFRPMIQLRMLQQIPHAAHHACLGIVSSKHNAADPGQDNGAGTLGTRLERYA
jgi:hypothetical protein